MNSARVRDLDIAFYRARVARDPGSARDFTQLAGLYLQRARETADNEDLTRAETNARRSLALRRARNDEAVGVLATSLMGQHRFAEAHGEALDLLASDSTSIAARGLVAESAMELGRYREADSLFGMLLLYQTDLGTAPRLARWAELRGQTDEARRLLRQGLAVAERRHGLPAEQMAWFHLRLGDLALRTGHLDEAARELDAGLAFRPTDHRLLGARARLAAVRHDWRRAAADGELAVSQALDPATLGLLAEAWRALGDSAKSAEYDRAMGLSVLRQPGAYHRAWSLYLLDHGRNVSQVLVNVRQELTSRQDIYGYDLLAWALHAAGRDQEARRPMARAIALGTQDAMLAYHAGMIARALGETAEARTQLRRALAINPWWHPTQPATARAVLDTLNR
ncbi:MAG TPA: tetratricopeptide repeat protein [Gemmatimonadales bacterium]|nr:tetratricopeptide repeat protein [Gemmatimonadales bacterium]